MSRVRQRRLFWDPVDIPDLAGYQVYVAPADVPNFLASVDAGNVPPFAEVDVPEFILGGGTGLDEGVYQFAVTASDTNGNFSDPHQPSAWVSVPLDLTPPPAPTGGGIEFVN